MTSIVWLANDLRLSDNPAIHRAAEEGPLVPVFIWAPEEEAPWPPGGAHRWWLHHSLSSLSANLASAGSRLVIRSGPSAEILLSLVRETGAGRVLWNDRLEPTLRRRDDDVERRLSEEGIDVVRFQSVILHQPDEIRTGKGTPYRVFSPFWKKFKQEVTVPARLPDPSLDDARPPEWPSSQTVNDLNLLPDIDWAEGLRETWQPGETGAHESLRAFVEESVSSYGRLRDYPDRQGTSMLSPHLRFGEISPRQVWNYVQDGSGDGDGAASFFRELGWREFSYHLLYHFPHTTTDPLDERYAEFPWTRNEDHLQRWQKGLTGYPLVDAGMRQLWRTGWMHNRVRMVVASFLTKDLLLPWQEGAKWFWDTLVDGDLANNTQGWQWAAGCGADAQPFFRIFNPVSQSKKFDADGVYVRRWIPEISALPDRFLHCPWEAPDDVLATANVELGRDYPSPVVDHSEARRRALEAFEDISS